MPLHAVHACLASAVNNFQTYLVARLVALARGRMLPFPGRPRPQWAHPQLARSQPARRPGAVTRKPALWVDPTLSQAGPPAGAPQAQQLPIEGNRGALAVIDPNGPVGRPGKASLPTDNESQDCKRRTTRVSLGALSAVMSRDSFGAPGLPCTPLLQSPAGRGREDGGAAPYERAAKRPCVSHAPAASPGRAALPCSPAAPCAAPGLGERRMARPFSPAPFGRPCSPGPAPPPSLRPPSQPPSPVQFALTPRAAHSAAFVAMAQPAAAAAGASDEGAMMRSAKRPCVSHAPAASPGRAALPCSPAPFRAVPVVGERRMARPFSPAPFGRPCSPGPAPPPPPMLRPPSQPPSPVQFVSTPRAAHSAAFVAVAHPAAAATGACGEGATMRSAKRPCVSHAPAASPGRAALPCSPAPFRAAPVVGERRMARPFSPAPARPVAPPNAPPSAVRPTALPPRAAACQEPIAFAQDQGW